MQRQEPIHLNIQLPAGALDGLTRLVEQLRRLAAEVTGGGPEPASGPQWERGDSSAFDPERFQLLGQGPEEPASARPALSKLQGADPVRTPVRKTVSEPESAWTGAEKSSEPPALSMEYVLESEAVENTGRSAAVQTAEAPQAVREEGKHDGSSAVPVQQEVERSIKEIQAVQAKLEESLERIPSVRAEAESWIGDAPSVQSEAESQTGGAPAVQMEPESQIPEAEAVWDAEPEYLDAPPGVQAALSAGTDAPQTAGYAVLTDPEAARNRWSGVTEELFTAGPAPLTAEAVSLAFRRDDRRYDSGFPLY